MLPPLDSRVYGDLAQPRAHASTTAYVVADSTLFDDIVMRYLMPMQSSLPAKTAMMMP